VGSFMGYVPADTPRLAILVIIDEPKGTPYGGVVAAPVFRAIAQQTLQYLNIPPTEGVAVAQVPQNRKKDTITDKHKTSPKKLRAQTEGLMPNLVGLSMRAALKWLDDMNVEIRIDGRGVLCEQKPRPGTRLKEGTTCYLTFQPP
jgi:cell division protein FtsI (penicillin-binding protein 3)